MARSPYNNGGYVGLQANMGEPLFPASTGSVGNGGTFSGATTTSWNHSITDPATNHIFMALSFYSGYDSSGSWVGTAYIDGVPMTTLATAYRIAVFAAPVTSTGTKVMSYTNTGGSAPYGTGNSVSFKNVVSRGTAVASGSDTGVHSLAMTTGRAGSLMAFFVGQAYNSAAPTTLSPSSAVRAFWNSGGSSSVGGFVVPTPDDGNASFSCNTGQYGAVIGVPILGRTI